MAPWAFTSCWWTRSGAPPGRNHNALRPAPMVSAVSTASPDIARRAPRLRRPCLLMRPSNSIVLWLPQAGQPAAWLCPTGFCNAVIRVYTCHLLRLAHRKIPSTFSRSGCPGLRTGSCSLPPIAASGSYAWLALRTHVLLHLLRRLFLEDGLQLLVGSERLKQSPKAQSSVRTAGERAVRPSGL